MPECLICGESESRNRLCTKHAEESQHLTGRELARWLSAKVREARVPTYLSLSAEARDGLERLAIARKTSLVGTVEALVAEALAKP